MLRLLAMLLLGPAIVLGAVRFETDPRPLDRTRPNASHADMLDRVMPAVVSVRTAEVVPDSVLRRFRGRIDQSKVITDSKTGETLVPRGLGSGTIIHPDGYVVTNRHVVMLDDERVAEAAFVQLSDGRQLRARVLGVDEGTDVAVLKVAERNLPFARFADSDKARVGDVVFAIGNPLGVGMTVTSGIVSATGRSTQAELAFQDFIQTDAAINLGNSGGALVDLEGRLIGINTAIISGTGTNAGIAFAVPVDMIASVMSHLERDGEVRRGQLGVQIQDLNAAMEQALQTGAGKGALVTSVLPGSAAEAAGIQASDVIVEVDGRRIDSGRELRNLIGLMRRDQAVELLVYRDGQAQRISAVVGGGQPVVAANTQDSGRAPADPVYQGAQLRSLDPVAGAQRGVEVVSVEQGSPAWQAGLRAGDVIYEVNRSEVATLQEFNQRVDANAPVTALSVLRENRRMLVIMS